MYIFLKAFKICQYRYFLKFFCLPCYREDEKILGFFWKHLRYLLNPKVIPKAASNFCLGFELSFFLFGRFSPVYIYGMLSEQF
jgi:hypothetical protein